jgi:archaellum biogenesis ATPase FlaH
VCVRAVLLCCVLCCFAVWVSGTGTDELDAMLGGGWCLPSVFLVEGFRNGTDPESVNSSHFHTLQCTQSGSRWFFSSGSSFSLAAP